MNLERQSFDIDEPQAGPSWAPKNWPQIDSDDLTAALDPQQMQVAVKAAAAKAGAPLSNAEVERAARDYVAQVRRALDLCPAFFEVKRYRVTVERRKNKYNDMVTLSEAVVVVKIGGEKVMSVSDSMDEDGADRGPVNALAKALGKDLGPYQSCIDDMKLVDFKVRITQGGTEAVTRVIIDSEDGQGRRWSTVGVSPNIVDASFEALLDAIQWKLIRDHVTPAQ